MTPEEIHQSIAELQARKEELQRLIFETQALLGKIDTKIHTLSTMELKPRPQQQPPQSLTEPMRAFANNQSTESAVSWNDYLLMAEESDNQGNLTAAEKAYAQAVDAAQTSLGPYDVNVAKCLLAYANFLESRNRYEEALLRFKLASGIYKRSGNMAAQTLAAGKVSRMEYLLSNGLNT